MALTHVAGADLDDPVRQTESDDQRLGAADHLDAAGPAPAPAVAYGEDLDLVELVGAQHAARVATGRAGLAAVARRVRHHPHRQLLGVDHLAGVDRGQRHLGGGDAPQVVALDGVGVVGELRQLTGGGERRSGDERRRTDLLERVGVAVERVLAQRPRQRGADAALHREHRPADLRGPLVVEDAERRARLPVRHPLVLGELGRQVDRALDDRVVDVARAIGRVGMRQVGDPQQQVAQIALHDVELVGQHALLVAEGPAAELQLLRRRPRRRCVAARPTCFESSLTSARMASRLATMSRDRASNAIARSSWSSTSALTAAGQCRARTRRGRCATDEHRSQTGEVNRAQRLKA